MSVSGDLRIGTELLGYRIEELVGRGGMGVVYRAFDLRLKRNVALKLVAPELSGDERFRARFLAETELAASLEHPSVVPIHDAGEIDDRLYLAMRYVEGSDLKSLLRDEGTLEPARALAVCTQVAGALDAAHEAGLVHRDVKPSNVLLDHHEHVYLADFGLTRRLDDPPSPVPHGLSLGTPAYAAPEQIAGAEVDGRADVYSLGCVLFECLNGTPPFARDSELAVLWAQMQEEPPPSPRYPAVDPVLAKALAKEPDERHRTCGELVTAARGALGIAAPARPLWSRGPVVIALGLASIAAALLAFFLSPDGGPSKPSTKPTLTPKVDSLQRIDPKTNKLTATIGIGRRPTAVATGAGKVWAGTFEDQKLDRIDPATNQITGAVTTGGTGAIAVGFGNVWVTTWASTLLRVDPETLTETTTQVGGWRSAVVGEGGVWTLGVDLGHFNRAGDPLATVPVGFDPFVLSVGAGSIWVLGDEPASVWRVDPARDRVSKTIPLGFDPGGMTFARGRLWVTNNAGNALAEIDPATSRTLRSIRVGHGPVGVADGEGALWVANYRDRTVSRIDPARGVVTATIPVGKDPTYIAAGDGGAWVTVTAS